MIVGAGIALPHFLKTMGLLTLDIVERYLKLVEKYASRVTEEVMKAALPSIGSVVPWYAPGAFGVAGVTAKALGII